MRKLVLATTLLLAVGTHVEAGSSDPAVSAQEFTGSIYGRIVDPSTR